MIAALGVVLFLAGAATAYDVTFTVIDGTMSYQAIEFKGTPTDWNTVPMDDADNDHVWTLTLDVNAGDHEWGAIENDGSEWGIWLIDGPNLVFAVDDEGNVTGQTSYEIVAPGDPVSVTLLVDMREQEVSPAGVHVAGSFQGWYPDSTELLDPDGDGVYEVTLEMEEFSVHLYKFINGDTWDGAETVPAECGVDDGFGGFNRELTVPAAEEGPYYLGVVFDGCDPITAVADHSPDASPALVTSLANHPNPFNPATRIVFELAVDHTVSLAVYDLSGRLVQSLVDRQPYAAGQHAIHWDAAGLASGTYFYRLDLEDGSLLTRKAVLLK
jgi:hypothetical protein